MTLANDSVLVTPGASGATVATHLVGGKEHQVIMIAGPNGHLRDTLDTWYVYADAVAPAQNKHLLTIWNGTGSGKIVKLRKLFLVNLALAAVTGVAIRLDLKRITTQVPTGGTVVTPAAADTTNTALPASPAFDARTGATGGVTESTLLFPITLSNDEVGATQAFPSSLIMQATNWIPEGDTIQEIVIRETQGLTLKCITNTAIGSLGVLAIVTVE